jgi:hypothetical protein
MRSYISNNSESDKSITYPYLGVTDNGKVVLFTGPNTGTQLVGGKENRWDTGYASESWAEENFNILPRESIIILSND